MLRFLALALLASVAHAQAPGGLAAIKPRSGAEISDFSATSTHEQVIAFCDAMPVASGLVTRLSLGTTHEGRDIPLLLIADPPLRTREETMARLEQRDTLLVLAIGNIHAGEVDGKEALMALARDLSMRRGPLLQHLILAIAPIYNADGNEPFSTTSRPGQDGPAQGQGTRENAQGLDLNRDFIKLDAPETRALVGFMRDWKPHVFIDSHTTDGSFHRFIMTHCGPKNPAGDANLLTLTRDSFFPAVSARFARANKAKGWDSFFYGNFEDEFAGNPASDAPRPHTRWETFPGEARYSTTYFGLRSRLSILTESYSYAPYRDRIDAQYSFIRCCLEELADRAPSLRDAFDRADRLAASAPADLVCLRTRMIEAPTPAVIRGFVETTDHGRSRPTEKTAEYVTRHFDRFEPQTSVTRPLGYVLSPECPPELIERLRLHGIETETVDAATDLNLSTYDITLAKPADRAFQKRVLVRLDATISAPSTATISSGSLIVRTTQPLGSLAVYLLEPGCEDGLAAWGFLDAFLKQDDAGRRPAWPIRRIER